MKSKQNNFSCAIFSETAPSAFAQWLPASAPVSPRTSPFFPTSRWPSSRYVCSYLQTWIKSRIIQKKIEKSTNYRKSPKNSKNAKSHKKFDKNAKNDKNGVKTHPLINHRNLDDHLHHIFTVRGHPCSAAPRDQGSTSAGHPPGRGDLPEEHG